MYQYGFNQTENRRIHRHIVGYILGKISLIELSIHNATEYIKQRYSNFIVGYMQG